MDKDKRAAALLWFEEMSEFMDLVDGFIKKGAQDNADQRRAALYHHGITPFHYFQQRHSAHQRRREVAEKSAFERADETAINSTLEDLVREKFAEFKLFLDQNNIQELPSVAIKRMSLNKKKEAIRYLQK